MRVVFLDPLEARLSEFPARYLADHEVLLTESPGRLPNGVEDADALVWWSYPVDAPLIQRLPKLRFLQRIGILRTQGDTRSAIARGIPVSALPFGVSDRVAQHALALTLAVLRKVVEGHKAVLEGLNPDGLPETETGVGPPLVNWARLADIDTLNDKTVGIVGFGEIGACFSRMLRPFDCRVLYFKRTRLTAAWERYFDIEYAELDELLSVSDIVAAFLPHSESTRDLLGAREFSLMKREAVFVNAGRGSTVDEPALAAALQGRRIRAAALDVFAVEPLPRSSPLLQLDNVVLAPHSAGGVQGWMNTFERIATNLGRVAAGQTPILPLKEGDPQPGE